MSNARFHDRALYLRGPETLVLADLHVGRAAASDVEYPLGETADLTSRLESVIGRFDPEAVVFAGDVLHRFDHASLAVERSLAALVEVCRTAGARPVFVRGNHDAVLEAAWDGPIHEAYELDLRVRGAPAIVRHGHDHPPDDESAGLYVVGHDHPTITIEGSTRPCYLYAERAYRGADVLMLPAFSRFPAGVEVNRMRAAEFQSPFVTDADALRPILASGGADGGVDESETDEGATDDGEADEGATDDALEFPPLGEFRRML